MFQLHYNFEQDPLPSLKIKPNLSIFSQHHQSAWDLENNQKYKEEKSRLACSYLHKAYILIMEALLKGYDAEQSPKSGREKPFITDYKNSLKPKDLDKVCGKLNQLKQRIKHTPPRVLDEECNKILDALDKFCKKKEAQFKELKKEHTSIPINT